MTKSNHHYQLINLILAYGYKEFLNKQCEDNQYGQFSERLDSNTISYTSTATSLYVDISMSNF